MRDPLLGDPMVRELVRLAKASQLSRRSVLKGAAIGATTLTLAACGVDSSTESGSVHSVSWANWPDYVDRASLDRFGNETGIQILYKDEIRSNESYYTSIKDKLQTGEFPGADTAVFTDWMVARLIRLGYLQELDAANIPNKKNLAPALLNPDFDPGRTLSLPWQNNFTGIAWNQEAVPNGLQSVDDLWRPELEGKVVLMDDLRDTVGLLMLNGLVNIASTEWGETEFNKAVDIIIAKKAANQILAFKDRLSYAAEFRSDRAVAGIAYSSDIALLNKDAGFEKFKFYLPASGGLLWGDSFVVPHGSTRKSNAEELINFYYQPDVAAAVAVAVRCVTPVVGARKVAGFKYPEIAVDPLVFPDDETLERARTFRELTAIESQTYQAAFDRAKGN
jgi:spermidine/putrescine transport system substrate-binding protein